MPDHSEWTPAHVNTEAPSAARVYDWLLGGGHNFAVDRAVGRKVLEAQPDGLRIARSNRAFLGRAVRYLVDQGITQFLDLGSGIPTAGNVHEVAQRANPESRVIYVDYDPVAVAHSQLMLRDNERASIVDADICEPQAVLQAAETRRLLDLDQPVALLTVAVFHFVPDERRPKEILAEYIAHLAPGSYVALSHLTADQMPTEMAGVVEAMKNSRDPMYFRSYAEISDMLEGLELVPPGLVDAPSWHREEGDDDDQQGIYAAVGRKP
ncbi:hypothetical protein GCM10011581_24540 [Saccharopolyspora subtropica]|uniref:SAM-dependent methyltransferase n=1 Tax=Saccharopolyspora thermophila TaxID=89367 RepID=A0A917JV49_9PSEU|nr:SAM-dependent methyltransferase [Saccharopolyspora subtropica]GGI86505.1 hypothetical protein GCM10011581_24540 [Saccharopolyspora subtropica]